MTVLADAVTYVLAAIGIIAGIVVLAGGVVAAVGLAVVRGIHAPARDGDEDDEIYWN